MPVKLGGLEAEEGQRRNPLLGGFPNKAAHHLSPAYVPDPMELDEHVPPYADDASPTAESPGYIADSDPIEEDTDEDSLDYPDEPEDGEQDDDEDPEEDPSKEHEPEDDDEDPEEDPKEEHEPEDEDTKEEEPFEGSNETKPFKEDETAITPPPPRHHGARISVKPQTPIASSTQALIDAFAAGSPPFLLPPTSPAYDQAPLGHKAAMIRMRNDIPEEDMPPQRRFVITAPLPGCDVVESSTTVAARAPRGQYDFVDTVEAGQVGWTGNGNNQKEESQLNIISYTKAQAYLSKGCDVYLAHITIKEAKEKSEGKRLEDMSIVRDFPKLFPEDLPIEFQIDLVPGPAPVARAPYRLAPSKMKELAKQLQELSDKGFIRPSSSP
ncbi:hypothetical protein Tco_0678788 [Tanacetum coccineum]|uniref:Reverse transcriptase domain-containing protein n=1 Tax=Tanacetum coccineum TaxID=301880 RepID=A0ABQ4XG17_9ASTR